MTTKECIKNELEIKRKEKKTVECRNNAIEKRG
jgi:hypothetical protein